MKLRDTILQGLILFLCVATTGPVFPPGCGDDGFILRDYKPRGIDIGFPDYPVYYEGQVLVLEIPAIPEGGLDHVSISLDSEGQDVRIDSMKLHEMPASNSSGTEPMSIPFVLEPDVDIPVYFEGNGIPKYSVSVETLTINIPLKSLQDVESGKAMLEIFTNATVATAGSEGICVEDLATGATSNWCSVSEAPTPKGGQFVIRIELRTVDDPS